MDHFEDRPTSIRTRLARGASHGHLADEDVTPGIRLSVSYLRDADNSYNSGRVYGRADNPGTQSVEAFIADLENGAEALLFASGTAAATAFFLALEPTEIVAPEQMYWGLQGWLRDRASRFGHRVTFVDMSSPEALRAAVVPGRTGIVWIETPSNPLWTLTDIAAACSIAHDAGARVCADSTVSTPILTKPLEHGADYVLHSATKYLNGHCDVTAGVIVARRTDRLWSRIRDVREDHGAVPGPVEAWMLMRGMRTLDLRMKAHSQAAMEIAQALDEGARGDIKAVLYPGLRGHPGHDIAARQMSGGYGGLLSIRLAGGFQAALATAAHVRLWRRATSFGGLESLIEHRASIEGAGTPCPDDLLRLSVGLEDPADLLDDLYQALDRSSRMAA